MRNHEPQGYTNPPRAESRRKSLRTVVERLLRVAGRRPGRPAGADRTVPGNRPGGAVGIESLSTWERAILEEARPYTMTSAERLIANVDAMSYVLARGIPGAIVECGVWRGGSVLAMIRTLQHLDVDDREIYLFDTFQGMTRPTERDTSRYDTPALETWKVSEAAGDTPWNWAFDPDVFNLEAVRSLVIETGYPAERIHLVKGRVEDTLPASAPENIALLRLDTDWYDSTRHELIHLYPRISNGGVLIVDDYGHWEGCRTAVDEYFSQVQPPILLARIDYTGRVGVKTT